MADYTTVRDILGNFIGQRLITITQHDEEEYNETREAYVMLMFEDGGSIKITLADSKIEELEY